MATDSTEDASEFDASQFGKTVREAAIGLAVFHVQLATRGAEDASLRRAEAVAALVHACDGNQSEAARRLGLHQSTINKLVQRAKAAAENQDSQGGSK